MKYILTFTLACFFSFQAICQKNEQFQIIDSVKEKDKILEFVREFGTCTDSFKIQKFIEFPYFLVRHTCNGLMPDYFSFPVFTNDSMKTAFYKKAKNYEHSQCDCHNPLYDFSSEITHSMSIRDSVLANNGTMLQYYLNSQKNKNEYCGWLINAYHFPKSFENIETSRINFSSGEYPPGNKMGTSMVISGYGFGIIKIAKINDEYKVVYVGYYWN